MSLDAAAIIFKNVLGLVCDPVAGLVEIPCAKRNVSGAISALCTADLVMAGVDSKFLLMMLFLQCIKLEQECQLN